MIDAHVHLHDVKYDNDRDAVIARCFAGGMEAMVTIGTNVTESRAAVALAEKYDQIYATVGLHPQLFNASVDDLHDENDQQWHMGLTGQHDAEARMGRLRSAVGELEKLAQSKSVKAIGEIGLEYFAHGGELITSPQKRWQRTGFVVQIALAKKLGLPVVIHCRPEDVSESDAYHDCVEILQDYPLVQFVMHCYMGNALVTEKFLALPNVVFSFTGNVTYSKSDDDQMSEVVKMIPLERTMIETDGPYLTPVPHRGTRNEPLHVAYVAERIAHLKGITKDEVIKSAADTARRFFDLA